MNTVGSYEDRYKSLEKHGVIDCHKEILSDQISCIKRELISIPNVLENRKMIYSIAFGLVAVGSVLERYTFSRLQESKWNEINCLLISNFVQILFALIGVTVILRKRAAQNTLDRQYNADQMRLNLYNAEIKQFNLNLVEPTILQIERNKGLLPAETTDEEILHFAMTGSVKVKGKL